MWLNPQKTADLVTLSEDILDGKVHFLCSDGSISLSGFVNVIGARSKRFFLNLVKS